MTITKRRTGTGETRYAVRYRLGGRAYPVKHAGSFRRLKEAKVRRDLVGGLIASGQDPAEVLSALLVEPSTPATFAQAAASYRRSRVDIASSTATALEVHIRHLDQTFGRRPVEAITVDDVQEWVAVSGAKPSTLRVYLSTLRRVLDHAGIEPNPARSPRIRLPRTQHVEMEPPSASDVKSMITEIAPRFRLALTTLAETGVRVGECVALAWPDVDIATSRFRIRSGKTRAARRWVPVPEQLMADILAATPPDDRTGLVFPDLRESSLRAAMRRACQRAEIAHYSPHDLRHRWASVQVARGVPITDISAALGHTDKAMTLNTYSHVLLAD